MRRTFTVTLTPAQTASVLRVAGELDTTPRRALQYIIRHACALERVGHRKRGGA